MVAIIVEGGVVREILSETSGEAVVIDMDVRGTGKQALSTVPLPEGEKVIANLEELPITANPLFIGALRSRITDAKA